MDSRVSAHSPIRVSREMNHRSSNSMHSSQRPLNVATSYQGSLQGSVTSKARAETAKGHAAKKRHQILYSRNEILLNKIHRTETAAHNMKTKMEEGRFGSSVLDQRGGTTRSSVMQMSTPISQSVFEVYKGTSSSIQEAIKSTQQKGFFCRITASQIPLPPGTN